MLIDIDAEYNAIMMKICGPCMATGLRRRLLFQRLLPVHMAARVSLRHGKKKPPLSERRQSGQFGSKSLAGILDFQPTVPKCIQTGVAGVKAHRPLPSSSGSQSHGGSAYLIESRVPPDLGISYVMFRVSVYEAPAR